MSRDEPSGSYLYPVRSDLWILMLDTNSGGYSTVPKETLVWLEKQLAEQKHAKVIAVSHQNLLLHNPRFDFGVRIGCAKDSEALYEQYGVLCNLSGHMHMQHILEGPVPESAVSSLPLSPNQYGVLKYDGATLLYLTKPLDVSAWAQAEDIKNEDLLHFSEYAHQVSMQAGYRQIMASPAESGLPDADKARMTETFAVLNGAYLQGIPDEAETEHHRLTITVD